MMHWICCQLGAREHYAIPRALHLNGHLSQLITDAWVKPQSIIHSLPNSPLKVLQERCHSDLLDAPVHAFTTSLVCFELSQRNSKIRGWDRMIGRNHWFQIHALHRLKQITPHFLKTNTQPVLFAYSYAALELLRYAKNQGWYTVLGQIDAGIIEEKIVIEEHAKHSGLAPNWHPTPSTYWEDWKEECRLADCIAVNSSWSKQLLKQAGIEESKIQIVPLVYESAKSAAYFTRTYPNAFSEERPLRALFLGLVALRKGIAALLDAIQLLTRKPVEFWMVGPQHITIPTEFRNHPQIRWIGPVSRSQTQQYYQQADIFLFPTFSDGFGLTQLEAQAWKLPIIASKFCGEVVKNGVNGLILPEVTGVEIAQQLLQLLDNPERLKAFSERSICPSTFNIPSLSQKLQNLTFILAN